LQSFAQNRILRTIQLESLKMAQLSADADRTDRLILHELQLDGRLTNATLAQRVNLSESACLRRVRRLEEVGLIRGYVGLVDQSSAGYPDNVFVRITLTSQQQDDLKCFEDAIRQVPEVMECYLMSGDADYLLRVIVADSRDYERVHSQHLTRLPGVDRVHSSFALRTVIKKTEMPVR
jgi:Lrp/AsnC family leucine-responsive transcriptional regulator